MPSDLLVSRDVWRRILAEVKSTWDAEKGKYRLSSSDMEQILAKVDESVPYGEAFKQVSALLREVQSNAE
jgi:hypothetical protein